MLSSAKAQSQETLREASVCYRGLDFKVDWRWSS